MGSVSLSTLSAGGLSADGNLDDSGVGWVGDPSQNQLIRRHGHLGATAEDSGAEEAVDSEAATGEGSEVDSAGGVEEEGSAIGAEAGAGAGSVGDEAGAGADSVVADLVGEVRPVEEASVPVTRATGAGVVDRLEASVVEVEDSGTSCSVLNLPIFSPAFISLAITLCPSPILQSTDAGPRSDASGQCVFNHTHNTGGHTVGSGGLQSCIISNRLSDVALLSA